MLNTIDQLLNGSVDPNRVIRMREFLNSVGMAMQGAMIDIYGGAGMQIAHTFRVQIQVVQINSGGGITLHPTIGTSGPLLRIVHRGNHFTPLFQS